MVSLFTPFKDKRILQINKILNNKDRERKISAGMTKARAEEALESENKPLRIELEELQIRRKFSHANWQLGVNLISIVVALFIAFFVPYYSDIKTQKQNIQSVYEILIANQDISISNEDELILAKRTGILSGLPQPLIEVDIDKDTLELIQNKFGIMQYQFFLYYLNQTDLFNKVISRLNDKFTLNSSLDLSVLDSEHQYRNAMESLSDESKDAKFIYISDTECLLYLFQRSFPDQLTIARREAKLSCSSESLSRLFNFGYIPVDTPQWLLPELQEMLNKRETGLGDELIKAR